MATPERDKNEHPKHDQSGHSHGTSRSCELKGVSDARLLWTVVLNQRLTFGQVAAGNFGVSVSLLSDPAHEFNDANTLLIA